jgi:hypothetical protein
MDHWKRDSGTRFRIVDPEESGLPLTWVSRD